MAEVKTVSGKVVPPFSDQTELLTADSSTRSLAYPSRLERMEMDWGPVLVDRAPNASALRLMLVGKEGPAGVSVNSKYTLVEGFRPPRLTEALMLLPPDAPV